MNRSAARASNRAAPSPPSLALELQAQDDALALRPAQPACAQPAPVLSSIDERITAVLTGAARALTITELRSHCRVRNATLYERLAALTSEGRLQRTADGYRLAGQN